MAAAAAAVCSPCLPVRAADDVWTIDPLHSAARFTVRHLMITDVTGEFKGLSGTVVYDGRSLERASVDAGIDASTINTRIKRRDDHLKSESVFDVRQFPTISFKSSRVIPGPNGSFRIVGMLTMHGVAKEVTLDAQPLAPFKVDSSRHLHTLTSASAELNRKDFGISVDGAIDRGGALVGDTVKVDLTISLVRPQASGARSTESPPVMTE